MSTFTVAIEDMVKGNEFEKCYNSASAFERRKIKHDEQVALECIDDTGKFKDGMSIPLMIALRSPSVMRDIICLMNR